MHRVTETTTDSGGVIEDHPAVHIMHGKLSDDAFSNTLAYLETLNEDNASVYPLDNITGIQTFVDYHHSAMKLYCSEMETAVSEYVKHCADPLNPKFQNKLERTIYIQDCWCIKMNKNDYIPVHSHRTDAKTGISTAAYFKLPEKLLDPNNPNRPKNLEAQQYSSMGGGLTFSWPGIHSSIMEDDVNPSNARHIYPELGAFWIFPKCLSHIALPYRYEGDRWSVSSNWNVFTPDGR